MTTTIKWNERAGRYYDPATGRFVTMAAGDQVAAAERQNRIQSATVPAGQVWYQRIAAVGGLPPKAPTTHPAVKSACEWGHI